jgi:hypothetical protein
MQIRFLLAGHIINNVSTIYSDLRMALNSEKHLLSASGTTQKIRLQDSKKKNKKSSKQREDAKIQKSPLYILNPWYQKREVNKVAHAVAHLCYRHRDSRKVLLLMIHKYTPIPFRGQTVQYYRLLKVLFFFKQNLGSLSKRVLCRLHMQGRNFMTCPRFLTIRKGNS